MSQVQTLAILKEGIAAAKAGNKVAARQLLRQAAALDPSSEAVWLWLAGLAESPLESVRFLERVLELNPAHEKARTALRAARVQAGIAAAKAQDRAQARLLLHRAVEHDPDSEIAWLWLASVAESAEEGARHLEKVLDINPNNERARAGLDRYRSQRPTSAVERPAPAPVPATVSRPQPAPPAAPVPAPRLSQTRRSRDTTPGWRSIGKPCSRLRMPGNVPSARRPPPPWSSAATAAAPS